MRLIETLKNSMREIDHSIASMDEKKVPTINECKKLGLVCADMCNITAQTLQGGSSYKGLYIIEACENICDECAEECEKYKNKYCKACAKACRKCQEACRLYLLNKMIDSSKQYPHSPKSPVYKL